MLKTSSNNFLKMCNVQATNELYYGLSTFYLRF